MNGRRIRDFDDPVTFKPGDYGRWRGLWYARVPTGDMANLSGHDITEHRDGTITASPSIKVSTSRDGGNTMIELWHGFLERGIWRNA